MSSIIEGYRYDIFISYRQKDNKYDGWVTEFVDNLKKELEATFKEEISVYFDINPHDGLLETHDVDASLRNKLKCLVFIPIISRTYCDPKSFAWEHEFKAFVEQASQDQFGLKITLLNGNVASRVLPVRIHDLDNDDIKLCESILGGVLRSIEFIYKSPGVNRPLRPEEESPNDNLNKTFYPDQINKVALAIKEIIYGLSSEPVHEVKEKDQAKESFKKALKDDRRIDLEGPAKGGKVKLLSTVSIVIVALLIIAAILAYPKIFKKNTLEKLRSSGERISVAVMPFQNLTNDTIWDVWQSGIQNELITSLTNSEELKVRQTETVNSLLRSSGLTNYATIHPSDASKVSQKLETNVFIHGSINQAGSTIRLNARLINSKTENVYKSFQIDGTEENILEIIDSLSAMVKNSLIISKLVKDLPLYEQQYNPSTKSSEAYRYYLYGENARSRGDYPTARKMFAQALAIDSNFIHVTLMLSVACINQGLYEEARKWGTKAYEKIDQMPLRLKILTESNHAFFYETPNERIKYLRQFLEIDDKYPGTYYDIGFNYYSISQYDKAIPEFEKSLEIYEKLKMKPWWVFNYTLLGWAYHETGQYNKEKKLYKKADKDFPDDPAILWQKIVLSLIEGDTITANVYIKKYISFRRSSMSEAMIAYNLGEIYSEAGILVKSEKYHRLELSLEPENIFHIYSLAWFLIDKDININEGLELINKSLVLSPDDYNILDAKSWGLYKLGKYKDALELIEKADSLKPSYNHEIFLHLEAAKKAVASQKNN
jgi:tetratricopeptide (TPR) repeat protein